MARLRQAQTTLTSGMLDPALKNRSDTKHYYSGAQVIENMELAPQGGGRVRHGLEHVARIDDVTAGGVDGAAMVELRFNRDQTYLVLITHLTVRIWHQGILVKVLGGPWTGAEIGALTATRAADTMLFFHPARRPRRLMRQGAHDAWTLDDMPIQTYPTRAFGTTVGTATPSAVTGAITITSSAGDFAGAVAGWLVRINGGTARITSVTSATQVGASVMKELSKTDASTAGLWQVEEPLWSDARGWPAAGTFHADRLYMAGSTQSPDTIAASRSGNYYNFDEGGALDDEAVVYNANSDEINQITALFSGNHLLIFTAGGEFATLDFPVTPSTVSAIPQTQHGTAPLGPLMVEEGVLFVTARRENERQAVMETVWSEAAQKYVAQDISLLAGTIIRTPTDMTLRTGTDKTRAYHVFLCNGEDGTCAVLNTLRSQDVTGWCIWRTAGIFLRCCTVGATVYFLVRRTIGGAPIHTLERLAPTARTDCSKTTTLAAPAREIGGFGHLAGATVRIYADGHREALVTVSAAGTVTLPWPASAVEAGLPFEWVIEAMPFAVDLPDGTTVDQIKRVVAVSVMMQETIELRVDGIEVPLRRIGDALLDQPPTPFTGTKRLTRLGFDRLGVTRLHGEGPATILGFMREVSI